jgi:hypothetical protein
MGVQEVKTAKTAINALVELHQSKKEAAKAVKGTAHEATVTRLLWREGSKSPLIKLGFALIAFPEPTPFSEMIGAGFVAAGAVQKGIQSRYIYMEDIAKTFKSAFREISASKDNLRF